MKKYLRSSVFSPRSDEPDQLKIMLALKSLSESNRRESHTNLNCTPPPDLHKLFR